MTTIKLIVRGWSFTGGDVRVGVVSATDERPTLTVVSNGGLGVDDHELTTRCLFGSCPVCAELDSASTTD